jgi:hypothetical protein
MTKANKIFYLLTIVAMYIIRAANIDLMDNDATQYAFLSQLSHFQGEPNAGRDLMEMGIKPNEFAISNYRVLDL